MKTKYVDIASIGGGLASFGFVDALRVNGINTDQIAVVGPSTKPYDSFVRRCIYSGIDYQDRLRSDSSATPGNVWGWPSFGTRELLHEVTHGHPIQALGLASQLFSEPILHDTYSPKLIHVIKALEREAARIDYGSMHIQASVDAITRHQDNWLVRAKDESDQDYYVHAKYLHVATGYQGNAAPTDASLIKAHLGDNYRHVYDSHEHLLQSAKQTGGVYVVRGRGIAASRVVERLLAIAEHQPRLTVVQLVKNKSHSSDMPTVNKRRVQPFNFPKDSFGGERTQAFIKASASERIDYIRKYGHTSTPNRKRWRKQMIQAEQNGQFGILPGSMDTENGQLCIRIEGETEPLTPIAACIDATGLERKLQLSEPIQNLQKRGFITLQDNMIHMTNQFEAKSEYEPRTNLFFAGTPALGGPYAGVDSFSGINFAAHMSACAIIERINNDHDLQLTPITQSKRASFASWYKWATGVSP